MNGEWEEVSIDDVKASKKSAISIGPFGSRLKSDSYTAEGVAIIRGNNLSKSPKFLGDFVFVSEAKANELTSSIVYADDLVFPHRGNIGSVGIVPNDRPRYLLSSSLMKLSVNKELVDPKFLFYFFTSDKGRHELLKNSSQVGTPGIATPLASLKSIRFRCPPLTIQKDVVHILSTLDNNIELNRQINQTLEAMAQALFKSWFVDFEPVRAKVAAIETGEDPNRAAMRAISGKTDAEFTTWQTTDPDAYAQLHTTASLFPDEFEESELGLVPMGWEVSEIGSEVEAVGGGTPSTSNPEFWEEGTIYWTSPKDLSGLPDKVLLSTASKITTAGLKKISSGLLPVNTVLMSSRAPVGYLALAKIPVAINQGYIAMKCTKVLTPEYALQWALSVMDEIKQRASGSTFAEISKTSFRPIKVLVPSLGIIEAYTHQVRAMYDMIAENVKERNRLTTLRDTLLPKLLSGEINLTDN